MSKIECTAVNQLIDLVQNKPLGRDSEEELLFSGPPAARRPKGTQPPLFSTSAPAFPIAPVAPAYVAPVPDNARTNPVKRPLFPVEVASEPTEARATMPVIWTKKPQFEPTPREDELETVYVERQKPVMNALFKQLAIPMGILLVSGIAIGGMITFRGEGGKRSMHVSAPSSFAAPALAALPPPVLPSAPSVEPIVVAPTPEKPKLVEIRLESTPPGATATLLSNGVTTPLGTTPVDASVDPSKTYDVVFAIDGRPPKVEHLDPGTTQHLDVALEEPAAPKAEPVVVATKPARHHGAKKSARVAAAHAKKVVAVKDDAPAPHAKKAADDAPATTTKSKQAAALASLAPGSSKSDAKPAPGATGTLSIATTPPCAILIDGQNSGLTSPQAAITLPAGHHTVRLIAAPLHINKLVAFDITPKHTTKLVQDYSK